MTYYETKITSFSGFSGATVQLYHTPTGKIVRKTGNVQRNIDKMLKLKQFGYLVPEIYSATASQFDMQYIDGIDIRTFLLKYDVNVLIEYLINQILQFSATSVQKDYTQTYQKNLQWIDQDPYMPFSSDRLIHRLPKLLPSSQCHGDLTLENLIYSDGKFYMIDVSDGDYDSWIFDIAKLRQDLDAQWFLRKVGVRMPVQLLTIKHHLKKHFSAAFDDMLYIVMLLRVYKHCVPGTSEHQLILSQIEKLWK